MFKKVFHIIICCSILYSLFAIDFILGNGLWNIFKWLYDSIPYDIYPISCKFFSHGYGSNLWDLKMFKIQPFVAEMLILFLTMTILSIFKNTTSKDNFYELLKECKDVLRQSSKTAEDFKPEREIKVYNELLQDKPSIIEIPLLHMAIVEMRGPRKPERCDAGDTIDIGDTTMISLTSLVNNSDYSILTNDTEELESNGEVEKS